MRVFLCCLIFLTGLSLKNILILSTFFFIYSCIVLSWCFIICLLFCYSINFGFFSFAFLGLCLIYLNRGCRHWNFTFWHFVLFQLSVNVMICINMYFWYYRPYCISIKVCNGLQFLINLILWYIDLTVSYNYAFEYIFRSLRSWVQKICCVFCFHWALLSYTAWMFNVSLSLQK